MQIKPGPFLLREKYPIVYCHIAYEASTSTAFVIEAARIIGRLVHISGLSSLTFNAVKDKVRASYR